MSRRRRIFATTTVLIAAVLVVLFKLPDVVGYVLEYKLRDAGFSDISIDIESITPTQSRINAIHASHPSVRLEASTIRLDYSLSQLLQGEIENISLETLQLAPPISGSKQTTPFVLPVLPGNWLDVLPFRGMQLNQVIVTLPEAVLDIDRLSVGATVTRTTDTLQLEASITARDRPALQLALTADSRNTQRLTIQAPTSITPAIMVNSRELSVTHNKFSMSFNIRAELVALRTLARQWMPQQPFPVMFEAFSSMGDIVYTTGDNRLHADLEMSLTGPEQTIHGPLSIDQQPGQFVLALRKSFNITAHKLAIAQASLPALKLTADDDINCTYLLAQANWQCGPARVQLDLPEVQYPPYSMRSETGMISLQQFGGNIHDWYVNANIELPAVKLELPDNVIRLDRVHTQLQASSARVKATTNLRAADGRLALGIVAKHDLRQQRGKADIELQPVSLDAAHNIPGKLLRRWPFPVSFTSGMVTGFAGLRWQGASDDRLRMTQHSALKLEDVTGHYRQFPFSGLAGNIVLQGIESLVLTSPTGIRLTHFNPGVVINDSLIQGTIRRDPGREPVITLTTFMADLLGGRISSQNAILDLNRADNPFTMQVQGLDLSELLELEQKEGLYGTGKLDGTLPLILGKDGLRMQAGSLSAQPPGGVIRYTGNERVAALAKANPNVDLLLRALSDFRYQLLEAELDYAPDGQLIAKLRLQGKNPELEGGRPVYLNVNIEENILALLRSLQFAEEISRKIGESIERGNKRP